MVEATIGVEYVNHAYWGTLRLTKIEVTNHGYDLRIEVSGIGYSGADRSLAKMSKGWLALPRDLAREVGEQLIKLSGESNDKWRKDYP